MAPIRTLYSESTDAKNFQGRGYKLDSSRERELESQCNELLLETEFFANKCSEFRNAKALAEARSDVITKELEKKNDKILHLQKKLNRYINDKNQNDLIKKQLKEEIK
ncbi:14062_t:CDS:1, partial [Dentiscutata erythropus]